MFEPFRDGRGEPMARCRCHDCGRIAEIRCAHEGTNSPRGAKTAKVVASQAIKKLSDSGWSFVAKKPRCPKCEAERRAPKPKEAEMTTAVTPEPREPTREQKREIMGMLETVYDTKAQRYRGVETDKTVAEALGSGILWGWVARLREEFFGPDGNEAVEKLIAEAREWMQAADALSAKVHDQHNALIASLREFNEAKARVASLVERLAGQVKPKLVAAK